MSNTEFGPGSALVVHGKWKSGNCRTSLDLQQDGNLVVYRDGIAKWQAEGAWPNGRRVAMEADGNFVLYGEDNRKIWESKTLGNPGSFLAVQDDGNVVIYKPGGIPIWHTNTADPSVIGEL